MTAVCRELFKAIHQGKWLSIAYKNKNGETTKCWIAVKALDPRTKWITADGLHLGRLTVRELSLRVDNILSANLVDGSYCPVNQNLVDEIRLNPQKYAVLFSNIANLRILDYLAECNKLDSTPYKAEYALIQRIDDQRFEGGALSLDDDQFKELVAHFQRKSTSPYEKEKLRIKQLALNLISVNARTGLYVLAYQPLALDVKRRALRTVDEPVICKEFTIDGNRQSIRQFLDADDFYLLEDFEKNQEQIKDRITRGNPQLGGVDDMPYLIAIGRDCLVDLEGEYKGILEMYQTQDGEAVTPPIRAFFGDLTTRSRRTKSYPLALINRKVNLDQLLAMNNALRNPLAYVQGPPGTGKTNTIVNTITTAFFNERTVLFASYNNHPIDGVYQALQKMQYHGRPIPLPMVRLGSNLRTAEALLHIRKIYEQAKDVPVYAETLDRNKQERTARAKQLTILLERYDTILDLKERKETVEKLLESRNQLHFQFELQAGQLPQLKAKLLEMGTVTTADALPLLDNNEEDFLKYLYYTSVRYIKRLDEPKNKDLRDILYMPEEKQLVEFNRYLSDEENLKKLLRIFPLVATTCISAHKLGDPAPIFDMVIMDEASQCNTAMSLVPIIRGKNLMLVGDPQQLRPVILLDQEDNRKLRKRYGVTAEYDYIENSIYKVFLACDSVSDEVLLSYHYRCHPKIIEFNNRKYYNRKLHVASQVQSAEPLVYQEIPEDTSDEKNTAPQEARAVVSYIESHPDKKVGVITPFAKQRSYIDQLLKVHGLDAAACGTVHAFQGDEKDVILFSLALTNRTRPQTYHWLKSNKELINVATSRAVEQLVILSNSAELERLHGGNAKDDDLYELVQYVRTNGVSPVTEKPAASRALGIKPYSTKTEEAFLENLNHALDNVFLNETRCVIHKEVPIAQVFENNFSYNDLFYTGRFDFVVYQRDGKRELPILAIELDGKEHIEDSVVRERDRKKEQICREHGFELIRVENSYARRYHYIKDILIGYFHKR